MRHDILHINFFFRSHDLFAADLHLLHTGNFVSHEADEFNVLRRLAKDPFFIVNAVVVFLAPALLRRVALGHIHQFFIHPNEHAVVLKRFAHLRRKGFGISLGG